MKKYIFNTVFLSSNVICSLKSYILAGLGLMFIYYKKGQQKEITIVTVTFGKLNWWVCFVKIKMQGYKMYTFGYMLVFSLKGDLSCKRHFLMSFIHKYVSQGTHKVSENKNLSLFLCTQISKNGGTTELIQICVRYDVISEMLAGFTPTALSETLLSETMPGVFWT